MGVVSKSWFDRALLSNLLRAQTFASTDVQIPFPGTHLGSPYKVRLPLGSSLVQMHAGSVLPHLVRVLPEDKVIIGFFRGPLLVTPSL